MTYGVSGQSDCVTNHYSITRQLSEWTMMLSFHLLEQTILNSLSSHLLWFIIVTMTIHTYISEGPNIKERISALNSHHKRIGISPIHQLS